MPEAQDHYSRSFDWQTRHMRAAEKRKLLMVEKNMLLEHVKREKAWKEEIAGSETWINFGYDWDGGRLPIHRDHMGRMRWLLI